MQRHRLATSLLLATIACGPAQAHDAFGVTAPFWSGALHALLSPLALAVLAAFSATLSRADRVTAWRTLVAAAVAAGIIVAAGVSSVWLGPACAVLCGLVAATGIAVPSSRVIALGACAGVGIAAAAAVDSGGIAAAAGLAFVVFSLLLAGDILFQELEPRFPLGRRVVGAWVAAIGLLLGALSLRSVTGA